MTDKETLSDKILWDKEAKLKSMYGIIQVEHVQGFINDLKEGTNRVIKTYTYSEMYREMHKLIYKLAGPKLANHSPPFSRISPQGNSDTDFVNNIKPEDTNDICECGQFEWEHPVLPDKNYKPIKGCKKFKPKKKGCGEDYIGEEGEDLSCGEVGLCSACSLRPTRSGDGE